MSTIVVLMGLLLLSYVGGFLATSRRDAAGAGLPSGSEFLLVGVVAGPLVFDLVTRASLSSLDPIAYVAVGWLALTGGLEYGQVGKRRVSAKRIVLGVAVTAACGALVATAAFFAIPFFAALSFDDRLLLAGGLGCVCAESTRSAIDWVIRRYRAEGPVTELFRDLAHADDVVPMLATALLFALRPPAHATVHVPTIAWAGATFVVGVLLGLLTAVLLARDLRVAESWGTLLGTSLMTIGLAARLDLAAVTAMFMLGASIGWFSRHAREIRAMVHDTERAVALPTLVLAGARLDPSTIGRLAYVGAIALVVRLVAKWLTGALLRTTTAARGASALLGFGLASSGGLSISIALAIDLRFPGRVGDTILGTAVAATAIGELAGPVVLRRILDKAGEIPEPSPTPPSTDEAASALDDDLEPDHRAGEESPS